MSVNEVKMKKANIDFQVKGTGRAGSRTFMIGNEGHTLGNALRHVLSNNANVAYAGYSVPHPSEPVMNLRIQTTTQRQGPITSDEDKKPLTAIDALRQACSTLDSTCDIMLSEIERLFPAVKEDRIRLEQEWNDEEGEEGEGEEGEQNAEAMEEGREGEGEEEIIEEEEDEMTMEYELDHGGVGMDGGDDAEDDEREGGRRGHTY